MSTAVIESPIQSASQLCFAWADAPAPTQLDRPALPTAELSRFRKRFREQSSAVPRLFSDELPAVEATEAQSSSHVAPPSSPLAVRGTGEVRIGSVMIKLLKRYGITDAEIAEGLATYAQKHCHSSAS